MRIHLVAAAAVLALAGAAPTTAQERSWHGSIAAGNYAKAERKLLAERLAHPERADLMLNLAAVYLRTGRPEQARALYADVLARAPEGMEMASGRVSSSHAVARTALASLGRGTAFAAR